MNASSLCFSRRSAAVFCLASASVVLPSLPNAIGAVSLPVSIAKDAAGGFSVQVDGKPFATYVVDQANKPYFWPVYGPTGKSMTRSFPMKDVPWEQKKERDHYHHRGITFGHDSAGLESWTPAKDEGGQVSAARGGGDTWTEAGTYEGLKNPKSVAAAKVRIADLAKIAHKDYPVWKVEGTRVEVGETCEHRDGTGKRFLTEERHFRFEGTKEAWILDFDQELIASDGPVRLDDRKDAGLGIRVPASMAVDANQGGRVVSSEGLENAQAWSKPAKWCDYTGPVEGETLGVAFMSHPSTFRFPDRWHVRTYGLFAVNPFAAKAFDASLEKDEPTRIPAGGRLKLRHRFVFHSGDAKAAGIEALYESYSKEPR
jgi:hypothetical protein